MKNSVFVCLAIAVVMGLLWISHDGSNVRHMIEQYVDNGDIVTFEAHYTPESIMELRAKDFLNNSARSFHAAELKYHPYVLFEVKYSGADKKTKEGILLWDLVDGEMVVNCETWDKSHGYADAIKAYANRNDFKIINALAHAGSKGRMTVDQLQRELQVESDLLQAWMEAAKDKHLIVQRGKEVQLHFENPKICFSPQTILAQSMVTKPYVHAQKISRKYSIRDIERISQAAFGQDFSIRSKREVFLPILRIEFINPDDSILTTYWNALNGKEIVPKYLRM